MSRCSLPEGTKLLLALPPAATAAAVGGVALTLAQSCSHIAGSAERALSLHAHVVTLRILSEALARAIRGLVLIVGDRACCQDGQDATMRTGHVVWLSVLCKHVIMSLQLSR